VKDCGKHLLLILLLALASACDLDRPTEFSDYDPEKYERVSINYEISGTQDTTLIFIHDWNLNLRYWDDQVAKLKGRYRILNLDLAGHGDSGKDRDHWTAESFARDITTIIEKEKITRAILIGHSLGSEVALQIQKFVPERVIGMIAIEAFKNVSFNMTEDFEEEFHDHLTKFKSNYVEMSDEYARKNIRSRNRKVINRIVQDYKNADPKIALAIYKNIVPKLEEEKENLLQLPYKLILILSDYDKVDEESLKRYLRAGYEIEWIHDAGHFPMVEQPEQFQIALESGLSKIYSQKPAIFTNGTK
jgi:sigma-B regulation protein RsbQ